MPIELARSKDQDCRRGADADRTVDRQCGRREMPMSAGSHAVSAIMTQRTIPARAASIAARAGPRRSSSGRPRKINTTTSAATDSDHNNPAAPGLIPAASQRITEKLSCMAWLPRSGVRRRCEQARIQPDRHRDPELADSLTGQDRSQDKCSRTAAAHPAIMETGAGAPRPGGGRGAKRQRIAERCKRRQGRRIDEAENEQWPKPLGQQKRGRYHARDDSERAKTGLGAASWSAKWPAPGPTTNPTAVPAASTSDMPSGAQAATVEKAREIGRQNPNPAYSVP
jgi:hypothetical protein